MQTQLKKSLLSFAEISALYPYKYLPILFENVLRSTSFSVLFDRSMFLDTYSFDDECCSVVLFFGTKDF